MTTDPAAASPMRIDPREIAPAMRRLLALAAVLVAVAGVQLYVLTDHTDVTFAWTIGSGLSASFLGAGYLAACVLEISVLRQRAWANARAASAPVFVFAVLTLAATLMHRDAFHFSDPRVTARVAAWAWLVVYVAVPFLFVAAYAAQRRAGGVDLPRLRPLPRGRVVLAVQAVLMIGFGLALFAVPARVAAVWPWPLTALTGRAVGAWLVGAGMGVAVIHLEGDWTPAMVALPAYAAFGLLQLVALARYANEVAWGRPSAWLYTAFMASIVVVAGGAWVAGRRAPDPEREDVQWPPAPPESPWRSRS